MLRTARSWLSNILAFSYLPVNILVRCKLWSFRPSRLSCTLIEGLFGRETRTVSGPKIASNPIETATIRKLRIRLLPFLFALYVVAFIDRINLGFAALAMNRELAITSQQFGFAAGI